MRRTIITNLQWWLLVGLLTLTFTLYPDISRSDWWWSTLFIVGFYAALMAVLRLRFETPQQARDRRRARTVPVAIFRSVSPVGNEKAPRDSQWYVSSRDGVVRSIWAQTGTYRKPVWSQHTPAAATKPRTW